MTKSTTRLKKLLVGSLVGAMTIGGLAAFKAGGERGAKHEALREVMQAAELTEDQVAELKAMRDTLRDQRKLQRADRGESVEGVLLALEDGADAEALHALLDQRVDERRATLHQNLDSALEFWDGLDAQQQAQALEKIRELSERRAEASGPFRE